MKQFNVEEYLKNPEKRVVTRDGRKARILCCDLKNNPYIVVAAIPDGNMEVPLTCTEQGKAFLGHDSGSDLFFAPEKHEVWTNVYRRSNEDAYGIGFGCTYSSEEEAKDSIVPSLDCVATVKIEWEE